MLQVVVTAEVMSLLQVVLKVMITAAMFSLQVVAPVAVIEVEK